MGIDSGVIKTVALMACTAHWQWIADRGCVTGVWPVLWGLPVKLALLHSGSVIPL